jgi:hypothetical protein
LRHGGKSRGIVAPLYTVLSPDEARQFAAELKRIADVIDLLPDRERGE